MSGRLGGGHGEGCDRGERSALGGTVVVEIRAPPVGGDAQRVGHGQPAGVGAADRHIITRLFAACGRTDEVPREADIDYLTGHSGTGPAYPALLATALIRDAVAHGLPEAVARRAAVGILIGAGRLFEATDADPAAMVQAFVDYRGVTAAGIAAMRAAGFDAAVAAGLAAALQTSRALGAPE